MQKENEIIFKLCKTCNGLKEIERFRPHANNCKTCANKKDAANHLKRNKVYYEKHREKLIKQNTDNYIKRKLLKEAESIQHIECA